MSILHFAWNIDTFVKSQHSLSKINAMEKTEEMTEEMTGTGCGTTQVWQTQQKFSCQWHTVNWLNIYIVKYKFEALECWSVRNINMVHQNIKLCKNLIS